MAKPRWKTATESYSIVDDPMSELETGDRSRCHRQTSTRQQISSNVDECGERAKPYLLPLYTTNPSSRPKVMLYSIQALRAVAALEVAYFHLAGQSEDFPVTGSSGVHLFFV